MVAKGCKDVEEGKGSRPIEQAAIFSKLNRKGCKDVEQGPRPVDEAALISKLNRNILAPFFVMTVLCYIDRTNLAFAALQLNTELGFTEKVTSPLYLPHKVYLMYKDTTPDR